MFGPAMTRFWRGVREPWELMGRMRHDRALWARYWRTVVVQAALTLVAGLGVFWMVKHGAEAWNDAFGPEEPAAVASETAGSSRQTATAPPSAVPATPASKGEGATGEHTPPGNTVSGEAADPANPASHPAPSPSAASKSGDSSGKEAVAPPPAGEDEDEDDDAESSVEREIEEKSKELENLPPEEQAKRGRELAAAAFKAAAQQVAQATRHSAKKGKSPEKPTDLADERESVGDTLNELVIEAEALALKPPSNRGEARRARRGVERKLESVQKEAKRLEARGAAPLSAAENSRIERIRTALYRAQRQEGGLAGRLGAVLALLAAIYASLGIAQTGVLALTRDFHDALSRDLSLLVNVAPEDPPMRPKVRLDLPWVRRKANRRAQFFMGFFPGTALLYLVTRIVPFQDKVFSVLTALWAAYWWMVMTAGQSARAWSPPETTPRPWYLRAWFTLTERIFLLRVFRWWGWVWERFARRFYGPSERVEEQPLEFAGLGLSRAVLLVPVLKLLFRPVFPVCAARLLVEHAATARLPVPVTSAEVAAAAERAPDAEARAHSGVATTG